ncbi:FYVE zinc finger-domain-containing protein [Phakopsora pachyrhizi]|uniref:FYVE zinc finger-domain-containing protein n=1 Tax=Phakopsora pachyrhizi TaxID=170000 RepID=A0AAV0BD73_PHAPC|nr:FYVE zinc finger-domain-containing protein [Phakopsora pachyrhizi]
MQDWINALREAKYEYLNGRRSLFINEDGNKSSFHKPDARSIPSRGVSWLSLTSSDSSQSNSTRLESINLIVNPTRNVERSGNGSGGIPNAPIIKSQDSMDTHTWSSKIPPRQDERLEKSNLNSSSFSWKSLIRRSLTTITRNQYSSEVSRADSEEISTTDPNKMVEEESQSSSTNSQKIPNQPALSDAPTLVVAENYSAPVWVPDNDVRSCMGNCSSRFGLLTRRHHCRLCGGVFCACCSSKTFVITSSEEGDKLARSCNSCYQSIFLDPRETQPYINYNKSLGNEAKDKLSSSDSRPYDDLDLTTAEENSRKAHLRRDYRQSLPTSLAAANLKQNPGRTLVEDPRTSMVSSTSLGQDSVSAGRMSCFSSPLINCNSSEADDVIVNLNTLVTGVDSDARKKLSSLLNKSG